LKKRETYEAHAEFCKTFGHPIRLAILEAFREGEMSVSELERAIGATQSTISQQLGFLRKLGVVWTRREGQKVFYRLTDDRILKAYDIVNQVIHDTRMAQARAMA
jgi:ArsR family transcriptional regulator, virulence genes transcriptional regulator